MARYSEMALAEALSPKKMELIILPTEKCNFRCTYCYEDFLIGRMKPQLVEGLKIFIKNRVPKIEYLVLSWFGGEPLLAKDICLDVASYAKALCEEHNVHFSGGFTTNGYLLTKELLEELLALNQTQFQISLDGDEEWHNKTRIQPNRKPTFQKIWDNLLSFKDVQGAFKIILRLHVHKDNIDSVKRLHSRIKDEFASDSRFTIYFHRITNLSSKDTVKETVLSNSDYTDALAYITDEHSRGKRDNELALDDYICYAAKPNSLLIRANGTIGKCTVALDDERNNIGQLLENGSLDISNPKLRQWLLGYTDLSTDTLGCPLATLPKASGEAVYISSQIPLRKDLAIAG